ncbi:MAG TPA: hypothetical protein DCO75_01680, partial [Fibrobacteres bacterium]|nr:hypothetical protein [Fibrobacterota bacterium]
MELCPMAQSEFIKEFFAEARENLQTAEEDVLALEQAGPNRDAEMINRLFRSLHSIKGGAACVNLSKIKELAHAMENVVGMIRDGTLAPTHEISQSLLDGLDKLKTCIETSDENPLSDAEPLIVSLGNIVKNSKNIDKSSAPSIGKKSPDVHIFDLTLYDLSIVKTQLLHVYEFTLDITLECKKCNCTPAELYQKLSSVGSIIADTTSNKTSSGSIPCSFLLATMIDDPEILFPGLDISPISFYSYKTEEIPAQNGLNQKIPAEIKPVAVEEKIIEKQSLPIKNDSASKPISETDAKHTGAHTEEQAVRIPVELLDKLMNLVGELVVVRNRNAQLLAAGNAQELSVVSQRLNAVTSEIQMTVMQTRMRPVGGVFNRFTRVVRDLSRKLGKEIELDISGGDVELDKSIIDNIAEPLTHLVRNAADHGLESAEDREHAGKSAIGRIRLSARHQAGMVNIQVIDDGKGMDPRVMRAAAVKKGICTREKADAMT